MKWLRDESLERHAKGHHTNWKKLGIRPALPFEEKEWQIITEYTAAEQEVIRTTTGPHQAITAPEHYVPQQDDGYNCGMFVCLMMDFLHRRIPIQRIAELDINGYRKRLAIFLLKGRLPNHTAAISHQPCLPGNQQTARTANRPARRPRQETYQYLDLYPPIPQGSGLATHRIKDRGGEDEREQTERDSADSLLLQHITTIGFDNVKEGLQHHFLLTAWHWEIASRTPQDPRYQALVCHLRQHKGLKILAMVVPPTTSQVALAIVSLTGAASTTTVVYSSAILNGSEVDEIHRVLQALVASSKGITTIKRPTPTGAVKGRPGWAEREAPDPIEATCTHIIQQLVATPTIHVKSSATGVIETSQQRSTRERWDWWRLELPQVAESTPPPHGKRGRETGITAKKVKRKLDQDKYEYGQDLTPNMAETSYDSGDLGPLTGISELSDTQLGTRIPRRMTTEEVYHQHTVNIHSQIANIKRGRITGSSGTIYNRTHWTTLRKYTSTQVMPTLDNYLNIHNLLDDRESDPATITRDWNKFLAVASLHDPVSRIPHHELGNIHQQQDAYSFLDHLLDTMENEISYLRRILHPSQAHHAMPHQGTTASCIKCPTCRTSFEPTETTVPSLSILPLQDCSAYTLQECLDWNLTDNVQLRRQCLCNNADTEGMRQFQRTMAYRTVPAILFVQIKIFTQTNRKVHHNITLNPQLYLPTLGSTTSTRYYHRATVWHCGANCNDGHYVATAMNPLTGNWLTIDDERVHDPMLTKTSEQPYLVAYTLEPPADNQRLTIPNPLNFFQPKRTQTSSENTRGLPNTGNTCYANATMMMLRHLPAMQAYIRKQHPGDHFDFTALINRIVLASHQPNTCDPHQQADLLGREGTFIKATITINNHGLQTAFRPGNASIPAVDYLIEPDNPLGRAGIQIGDHITEIEGTALTQWAQGIELIRNLMGTTTYDDHRQIKITVYRPVRRAPDPTPPTDEDDGYDWAAGEEGYDWTAGEEAT
jgi:hypothetical protein